jgi:hypothetical protein
MRYREAVRILGKPSDRVEALMKLRLFSRVRHASGRTGWCNYIDYNAATIGVASRPNGPATLENPRNWSPA